MRFEKLPHHFIADNARESRPHAFRLANQLPSSQQASAGGKRRACRREQAPPPPGPPHQVSAPRLSSPPPARPRSAAASRPPMWEQARQPRGDPVAGLPWPICFCEIPYCPIHTDPTDRPDLVGPWVFRYCFTRPTRVFFETGATHAGAPVAWPLERQRQFRSLRGSAPRYPPCLRAAPSAWRVCASIKPQCKHQAMSRCWNAPPTAHASR